LAPHATSTTGDGLGMVTGAKVATSWKATLPAETIHSPVWPVPHWPYCCEPAE
jgi:hypothetical protein